VARLEGGAPPRSTEILGRPNGDRAGGTRPVETAVMAERDLAEMGRAGYWDDYYAHRSPVRRPIPSQFAAFVAGELEQANRIIELGCGSGRDAIFFASYGHDVTGVDASVEAVKSCDELAENVGVRATFLVGRIDDPRLSERLDASTRPLLIYARFFLHAISPTEEQAFLDLATALTRTSDKLAVEYRTVRDASGAKVTEKHYRRFVVPARFEASALERGFDVSYAVEGFGFAKYKHDDAYVARTLLVRR
jgi:SAM-dependent methyltransferase